MNNTQKQDLYHWKSKCPPWWVLVLFMIPILRHTVFYRAYREDVSNYTAIDSLALFDIGIFGISFFVACYYWQKTERRNLQHISIKSWIVFYILCFISALWRFPGTSAPYIWYRAGAMLIMTAFTYIMFARMSNIRSTYFLLLGLIDITMLSGFLKALSLGYFHTNGYSVNAAVLSILSLISLKIGTLSWKQAKWFLIPGMFCLVCGTSSGSNLAFLGGLIFFFSLSRRKIDIAKFIFWLIILFVLYHFFLDIMLHTLFPGKSTVSISTMSGRMMVWETAIHAWRQRPLIGWGFNVGERALAHFGGMYAISAHNGILSVLLGTGIIGLTIFLCYICSMCMECNRKVHQGNPYAAPILGAMIVLSINNMSVPTMGSYWGQTSCTTTMLLMFFLVGVCPKVLATLENKCTNNISQ